MTVPIIVFPDAVSIVRDWLYAELLTTPVYTVVPTARPSQFVIVRRLGGVRRNLVTDEPLMTVECWAPSEQAAHDLAQRCRALVYALAGQVRGGVPIYRVDEAGGPANLPDPLSDQNRFVFTVTLALRGAVEAAS